MGLQKVCFIFLNFSIARIKVSFFPCMIPYVVCKLIHCQTMDKQDPGLEKVENLTCSKKSLKCHSDVQTRNALNGSIHFLINQLS